MENILQANNVARYLHDLKIFGTKLTFNWDKAVRTMDMGERDTYTLKNGRPSFMDFSNIQSASIMAPEQDMAYPAAFAYFENVPPRFTVDKIKEVSGFERILRNFFYGN